jgi:hypothetical protein
MRFKVKARSKLTSKVRRTDASPSVAAASVLTNDTGAHISQSYVTTIASKAYVTVAVEKESDVIYCFL